MAEITSGKNLTVIVLDEDEARLLGDHLGHEPTFPTHEERRRLRALVEALAEALARA